MKYWERRQEATYKAGEMQVNEYFKKLEKAFNQAKKEMQSVMNQFYYRYADENGLTYAQAQKQLARTELGELSDFIELAKKNIGQYSQEVNNLSIKSRITRYEALEKQIDAVLQKLYSMDYQENAQRMMQEVYQESYYRTWFDIDQYRGFHAEFSQIDPRIIEQLITYPFNGADFSSRLWKQKDHLQAQLMESMTTILVQGKHPETLAGDLSKKMQTKKWEAYRLLHTESSFLISEATHLAYKEDGVEKYQILATLDNKTCGVCGALDKQVYWVKDAVVGVNMPPFHCFCRCTDTPYYGEEDAGETSRAARDYNTGEYTTVPESMTYGEWKKKFAEKQKADSQLADYLIRDNKDAKDTTKVRKLVDEAMNMMPKKVIDQLERGTIIDVGRVGTSQYDYVNDILYIAQNEALEGVIHEIGHTVEHKLMDPIRVEKLKAEILAEASPLDFVTEIYYNPAKEEAEVFLVRSDRFVSEYQGRAYIDDWSELLDDKMKIKPELFMEFVSEPFREYILNPEGLKREHQEFYDLIREAVND